MKIVDTVYLVAYLRPGSGELHQEARRLLEEELSSGDARVSAASILELDLILKSRGATAGEREKIWLLLSAVIGDRVEPILPGDMALAAVLEERGLDYFDALIAAQCINRGAEPATTDEEILSAVEEYTA